MADENKPKKSKVVQQQKLELRQSLWPNVNNDELWDRLRSDGWLSIPRAMPLIARIMDNLSKGKPLSAVYLELWCRTYDDSFLVANKPREMAFYSGFAGERAETTWMSRIKILKELGFIDIADGPNGPVSYILIYNPYHVIMKHAKKGAINSATINSLRQRMIEIGAKDIGQSAEEQKKISTMKKKPAIAEIQKKK